MLRSWLVGLETGRTHVSGGLLGMGRTGRTGMVDGHTLFANDIHDRLTIAHGSRSRGQKTVLNVGHRWIIVGKGIGPLFCLGSLSDEFVIRDGIVLLPGQCLGRRL